MFHLPLEIEQLSVKIRKSGGSQAPSTFALTQSDDCSTRLVA